MMLTAYVYESPTATAFEGSGAFGRRDEGRVFRSVRLRPRTVCQPQVCVKGARGKARGGR